MLVHVVVSDSGRPIAVFKSQMAGLRWMIKEGIAGTVQGAVELVDWEADNEPAE